MSVETISKFVSLNIKTDSSFSFSHHLETPEAECVNQPVRYSSERFRHDLVGTIGGDINSRTTIQEITQIAASIDNVPAPSDFFKRLIQNNDGTFSCDTSEFVVNNQETHEIYSGTKQILREVYKIQDVKARNQIRDLIERTRRKYIEKNTPVQYGNYNGVSYPNHNNAPIELEIHSETDPSMQRQLMWDY